jgi:hypothetical protein
LEDAVRSEATHALSEEKRILLGLLVQPFLAAALTFASYPLLDRSDRAIHGGIDPDPLRSAIGLAIYVSTAAFFMTVLAAFPAAVWVLKRYELTFGRALLWGPPSGQHPERAGHDGHGSGLSGLVRVVLFGSFLGMAGAAAFWGIWVLGRPSLDGNGEADRYTVLPATKPRKPFSRATRNRKGL